MGGVFTDEQQMAKFSRSKISSVVDGMGDDFRKFASAGVIYAGVAIYIYQPYFNRFGVFQFLALVNVCVAGLGAYSLSRRWVFSFWASLFAGLLYGFGPLVLRINSFHPTAGLMAAMVPWLFCPAVYGLKGKWQPIRWAMCILPFLGIVTFFAVTTYFHLFAIPKYMKLHVIDLLRILAPTVRVNGGPTSIGFYHVAIAPLIMGFAMMILAKRFGILLILLAGLVFALSKSFLEVSPLMWATIPVLGFAVIIGEGMQGIVEAGFSDRKWVLAATMVLAIFSIALTILSVKVSPAFSQGAKMYMLGAVVVGTIYFMLRAKMRISWVKMLILCLAMGVDVFFGARFIVDMMF